MNKQSQKERKVNNKKEGIFPIKKKDKKDRGRNSITSPLLTQSFQKTGSIITDNEYEIKSEIK